MAGEIQHMNMEIGRIKAVFHHIRDHAIIIELANTTSFYLGQKLNHKELTYLLRAPEYDMTIILPPEEKVVGKLTTAEVTAMDRRRRTG